MGKKSFTLWKGCMQPGIVLNLRWHNVAIKRGKERSRDNTRKASSHVGDRVSTKAERPSGTWNAEWAKLLGGVFSQHNEK